MADRLYDIRRASRPWRSLEELRQPLPADAPELALGAGQPLTLPRRELMRALGAGMAWAGAGCTAEPPRKILPYTRRPASVVPGIPSYYATSMVLDGYAAGLVVETREGRPIKIEANPDHPATRYGTGLFHQAAIRQLYDDFRARRVRRGGDPSSWAALFGRWQALPRNTRLRILMEPTSSPLLIELLARVRRHFPGCEVVFYAPLAPRQSVAGARIAFGRPLLPQYDFLEADVILSLDAEVLEGMPFSPRYAHQWAERRRLESPSGEMNRLYVMESLLSVTGSMADNRLRLRSSEIASAARALQSSLSSPDGGDPTAPRGGDERARWIRAVARDLARRPPGRTLVVVGERQPAEVHALGYALNATLGNLGRTITFTEPVLASAGRYEGDLPALVEEMITGAVDALVILEGNPVYNAPADLRFGRALREVEESFCLAYYENETAEACRWFAPVTHFLEAWEDARAYDGTTSFVQPLIRSLVDARTPSEVLAALAGDRQPEAYRLLHDLWTRERGLEELSWQRGIQLGLLPDTAAPPVDARLDEGAVRAATRAITETPPGPWELDFHPSPTLHDGRFANNAWLLEQPAPISKLTWDNAAFVSQQTAAERKLENEQVVVIEAGGARVEAPVFVVPGLPEGVVAVWLGYGRTGQEALAAGAGFNAYPLRTTRSPHWTTKVSVTPTAARVPLARTQGHWSLYGRPIAPRSSLAHYREEPDFTDSLKGPVASLHPEYEYSGLQWAMTIDTTICTGCSACMMACQTENNVLVVGKSNVLNSREMHWLRIDTYFTGSPEDPQAVHQPMLCQHCEKAPCEYVCPVNATVHSSDGLNEMVYNRCVGTRFCSNNCPYKVRRFNYFDYGERLAANRGMVALQFNPEVTVRERGVMEKCTYCVQRIRRAQIAAGLEDRPLRPGEVETACQAACPTGAIQFGSLSHPDTPMVRWRREPRSYAVLHDQGTQPRTMYLARIDNPNPEIS